MSDRDSDSRFAKSPVLLAAYGSLFDRIQDTVLILNGSEGDAFMILDINPSGLKLFAQPREKLVGRCLLQWLDASSREDFIHGIRVAVRRADWHRFDVVWNLLDHRSVTVEVGASILELPGSVEAIQLIARDVSAKRETELDLQYLKQQIALMEAGVAPPTQAAQPVKNLLTLLDEKRVKSRRSKTGS